MVSNNRIIVENQLFPVINLIKKSFQIKNMLLLSCEPYKKMSFRNRFVVSGNQGLIHLSIPLENGRSQRVPFKDVKICQREKWQVNHWRTLTSCFNKSPFFEYYQDALQKLFNNTPSFLFDFNLRILHWLKEVLHFPADIAVTCDFPEDVEDLRNRWLPKNFQDDDETILYPQVFEDRIGFQKNLSILDMLFNVGPQATELLKSASST